MSEPSIECSARILAEELEEGTWIVVLKADQMPHVAMLQGGICFSLEHDGNHRYPAQKLWRLIESRRIPTVLCRLGPEARGPVRGFFEAYDRLEGDANCFLPVRDHCASWFPQGAACDYVFQLVPLLDAAGKIERAGSLHLRGSASGTRYVFPRYDQAQIRERIADVRRTVAGPGD
jgi:hypothetical protein